MYAFCMIVYTVFDSLLNHIACNDLYIEQTFLSFHTRLALFQSSDAT